MDVRFWDDSISKLKSKDRATPNVGTIHGPPLVNAPTAADLEVVYAYTASKPTYE